MARVAIIPHLADLSGAQLVLLETVECLVQCGHVVDVLCPGKGEFSRRIEEMDIDWRVIPNPCMAVTEQKGIFRKLEVMQGRLLYIHQLRKYFKDSQPDVVIINSAMNFYAGLAARSAGLKTCYFVHEILPPTPLNKFKFGIVERTASLILAPSLANASMFHPDVQREKFRYVPLAVDTERFNKDLQKRDEVKKRLGLLKGQITVGTVCYITPRKGIDVFLESALSLYQQRKNIKFLVVGSPDIHAICYEEGLKHFVRKHGLEAVVEFISYTEKVEEVMAALDIFVLASRSESSPRVILEAMASSVPVVASGVGGVPELLGENERGVVVPVDDAEELANAIAEPAGDKLRRKIMGDAGREYAKKYHTKEEFRSRIREIFNGM